MYSSILAGRQRAVHACHAVQKGADLAAYVPNCVARSDRASDGENSRQPMNDVPCWKLPPSACYPIARMISVGELPWANGRWREPAST